MAYDKHTYFLEQLIFNLHKVDEERENIEWVSREAFLFHEGKLHQNSMCDLLIGFFDNTGLCIELKGSRAKRDKAIIQLSNGYDLMTNRFRYEDVRSKIVYYTGGRYSYENVYLPIE